MILPSQIYSNAVNSSGNKVENQQDDQYANYQKSGNKGEQTHSQEPHQASQNENIINPQVNMKKFAVTSSNFYRTS